MTTTTPAAPANPLAARRMTLRKVFEQQRLELGKLLPRNMSLDRLERMALTECVKNPKLLECTPASWALAMQTCAAQGLYPDSGLGFMYLIPSNNSKKVGKDWVKVMEVRTQRGYQGDIALARKSGEIASISAEVVHAKDEFKVIKGLDPSITHVPTEDEDPGALRACYAVAKLKSGETVFVVLWKRDVLRHMASAQGTEKDDSPWKKHPESMWRKTAIHELFKWLPKDTEQAERTARAILTDGSPSGQVVDTTALDLGDVPLPDAEDAGAGQGGGLDAAADRLETQEGPAAEGATAACTHPEEKNVGPDAAGNTACGLCGEIVGMGPATGRDKPAGLEPAAAGGDASFLRGEAPRTGRKPVKD